MFIAGPYDLYVSPPVTLNPAPATIDGGAIFGATLANYLPLGIIEDGFEIEDPKDGDPITGDNLGGTVQNGVSRGQNLFCNFIISELDAAAASYLFWPEAMTVVSATNFLNTWGIHGQAGRLWSSLASKLLFIRRGTTVASTALGTPVTTATPHVIRAKYAQVAEGFPLRMLFGTRHRKLPMRMRFLPYTGDTSNINSNNVTCHFEIAGA